MSKTEIKRICKKLCLVSIAVIVASIIVFIIIYHIFQSGSNGFPWSAGDITNYIGELITAAATIWAVVLTIEDSRKAQDEARRIEALPLFTQRPLERANQRDIFTPVGRNQVDRSRYRRDPIHETIEKEGCYLIAQDGKGSFRKNLDDEWSCRADRSEDANYEYGDDWYNSYAFLPLEFENIGRGPAINIHIFLDDHPSHNRWKISSEPFMMLEPSKRFTLGIIIGTKGENERKEYELVLRYDDLYENHYEQRFILATQRPDDLCPHDKRQSSILISVLKVQERCIEYPKFVDQPKSQSC